MLNVRLDKETEDRLNEYAEDRKVTKSSVVKEALNQFFQNQNKVENPYLAGKDLFGISSSGDSDRSATYKARLNKKLNEKHTH